MEQILTLALSTSAITPTLSALRAIKFPATSSLTTILTLTPVTTVGPSAPPSPMTTANSDASKNYDASSRAAIMIPANSSNSYRIQSVTANGLTGANSNWLLKVNGVQRTYNGNTTAPAGASYTDEINNISRNYNNSFEALPYGNATDKRVATGNTFTHNTAGNVTTYSYNGYQEFDVTYGFSAGHATADTYTGTITYTLAINAS
ncbi:hypothetical protein IIZ77_02275 [Candidatus Saccharibacteria bacterium]|nr:hypothetical protein [Candidatus Saccharibacteria bacterium]